MDSATRAGSRHTVRISPNELLRRKIAMAGLNASVLARQLEVHVQTIYNVTTAKRGISAALALKLSRRFPESVEIWLAQEVEVAIDGAELGAPVRVDEADDSAGRPFDDYAENIDGILVDREIESLLRRNAGNVVITPYRPDQVQPASYDLTVGLVIDQGFRELSEYEWGLVLRKEFERSGLPTRELEHVELRIKESEGAISYSTATTLKRGASAVVMARELVSFRGNYLAEVGSTSHHARAGLLVNHGFQIDPGFSGPIFVTAMNIGLDDFELAAGDKLVSLALRRLARAPDRGHRDDMMRSILDIGHKIDVGIKTMFFCRTLLDGGFNAESKHFDFTHFGHSEDEALDKAVSAVLALLAEPNRDDEEEQKVLHRLDETLRSLSISRHDAEQLIAFLGVKDRPLCTQALKHFSDAEDRQTLGATLSRLKVDPLIALRAIMDPEPL